jgi:hypothetical protein
MACNSTTPSHDVYRGTVVEQKRGCISNQSRSCHFLVSGHPRGLERALAAGKQTPAIRKRKPTVAMGNVQGLPAAS